MMLFGLTNAPATFCTHMNKILQPFLDRFVVFYLDEIVVYSNSFEEHVEHSRKVFQILREMRYISKRKSANLPNARYQGGKIQIDETKIRVIVGGNHQTR
ncbi:reverse transcriptase [Gossypium australe]|uniref:Reverse transcriptase n=1 Tax=Gossypium australe TaxID=47621 RepID=A0A5B6VPM6_9ROSI|nr:reverse transcriptase [Gossypium australe]